MTPPTQPPRPPKTLLGAITQAVQNQTKAYVSKLRLKPNARVPELWVQEADAPQPQRYPLLGDRYLVGRSSQSCDIVVRNSVVSQVHLSLTRDRHPPGVLGYFWRSPYTLRDENSTNGVFRGKRRIQSMVVRHGDAYTMGPAELANAVRIRFYDPPPWFVRCFRYGVYGVGGISLLAASWILLEWQRFSVNPLPNSVQGPVVIYARDGETPLAPATTRTHGELRSLAEFSPYLPKAVLASEDSRFNWHLGFDPIGVVRALVANIRGGELREGASTISQQLARSVLRSYVGTDDSAARKLREIAAAMKLETFYSKDVLLLTYLNRVYTGSANYGFEDAAQFYLGKSARELDLSEAAMLAGILPAPNQFNPVRNYQKAIEQRNGVLLRMQELGMISAEEAQRARRSRIIVNPKAKEELESIRAPYYHDQVYADLQTLLGDVANEGNFIVETGLDLAMQTQAEKALQEIVAIEGASVGFTQGAIATIDTKTGDVMALVGGVDYKKSQFNRATQARRQPGSTFKIFAYAAALTQGTPPSTSYSCAPLTWQGQSFAGCRVGGSSMDMYTAMAQSENVIALRVAQDAGLGQVIGMARRLGIRSDLANTPGLVLGQSEVSVLEMTAALGVFANGGVYNYPRTIRRVFDSSDCKDPINLRQCRIIYASEDDSERNQVVLDPSVADTMTELLRGVVSSGTGTAAAIGLGEAGKTGTTNDNVDLWFVGYVPSQGISTGVWLGNDDNTPTSGASSQAAKLWATYMGRSLR